MRKGLSTLFGFAFIILVLLLVLGYININAGTPRIDVLSLLQNITSGR